MRSLHCDFKRQLEIYSMEMITFAPVFLAVDFVDSTVAVVRAEAGIDRVEQLQGRTACFGPVGDNTWNQVIAYLRVTARQVSTPNCQENDMDVMMRYFGDMCAPYEQRNFTQTESSFVESIEESLKDFGRFLLMYVAFQMHDIKSCVGFAYRNVQIRKACPAITP